MDEKALKELTKEGCIVGKEAAESLRDSDVEMIRDLDAPPLYLSAEMLENIRSAHSGGPSGSPNAGSRGREPNGKASGATELQQDAGNGLKTVQKQDLGPGEEEEGGDDLSDGDEFSGEDDSSSGADGITEAGDEDLEREFENRSSYFDSESTVEIRDDRDRTETRTKVEILDEADISREEKDVPEFLQYYNDRYDRMKDLLMRRMEMKSATTLNRLERRDEGEEAATIGLVKEKYSTNSGKYIVTLEDKTGTFKALVGDREGQMIVQDEVIGVSGRMGGDIIYADSVIRPDLPIPQGVKTTNEKVEAAFISDLHMGSVDTLHKRLDRFADWLGSEGADDIGYLVMPGDVVEGVGNYPGQEEELEVTDIYRQYEMFEEWVEKIPRDIQILIGPGNHDINRLAEPQPRLPEKVFPNISDFNNVHRVQNPQNVRLHGIRSKGIDVLMYHGYSFDEQIDQIKELRDKAYEDPSHVMIDLLKRRHLAPTYGSNLVSPEDKDHLVIDKEPDVFVAGHLHSHANATYKGVNVIASSTFQAQTDFQKRVGHEPDPGKVTILDLKTRNTEVKQF
ncbi:MAG: metallophosphoesterase [Candidatus Nanohaloarchaea archaeon]